MTIYLAVRGGAAKSVMIDFGNRRAVKREAPLSIFKAAGVLKEAPCTQVALHSHQPGRVGIGHMFGCQ